MAIKITVLKNRFEDAKPVQFRMFHYREGGMERAYFQMVSLRTRENIVCWPIANFKEAEQFMRLCEQSFKAVEN